MASDRVDVVIIGAGAAGLGAARTARDLGLSFVVFEAMDRIGGRAFTAIEPFGHPWDHGCHWLHSADVNPFRLLADQYGFRYRSEPSGWRMLGAEGESTVAQTDAIDEFIEESLTQATLAGVAGRDIPVWDAIDRDHPAARVFRWEIEAEWSAPPERVSTLDVARYRDSDNNWPVEDGYGALVARHARGLPVELSTPVESVEWGGAGVTVRTPAGDVRGAAVVVTASTTVLADGAIRFDPPLPVWKQEAFASVPVGRANKVGIAVPAGELGHEDNGSALVNLAPDRAVSFQLRPFGRDFAGVYLAGPLCDEVRREGPGAAEALAIDGLAALFGNGIRSRIGTVATTCWEAEPTIRGAYAAALPGHGHRRGDLATPVGDRLFFAGEATHPQYFSTCQGADLSGESAVRAAAERIRAG